MDHTRVTRSPCLITEFILQEDKDPRYLGFSKAPYQMITYQLIWRRCESRWVVYWAM